MLIGCDFSSSPSKRKPIVLAVGAVQNSQVRLERLETFDTLTDFGQWLAEPRAWVGGFDMPFGLPRELVETLDWPRDWLACMQHYAGLSRATIRTEFASFCNARPVGGKFAHRQTDRPAGSSPSMKWVNPPVAFMLHAGVPLLLNAKVSLPGLHAADPDRVALEAYPGLLAREILGQRSYKSDDKAKQTPERLLARKDILSALERGQTRLGLRLKLSLILSEKLVQDPSGDLLDATLCLIQAAWAAQQQTLQTTTIGYGLPDFDPLEGWIVSA
jgi:hypothetical protein